MKDAGLYILMNKLLEIIEKRFSAIVMGISKNTKLVFIGRVIKPSLLARYQVSTS